MITISNSSNKDDPGKVDVKVDTSQQMKDSTTCVCQTFIEQVSMIISSNFNDLIEARLYLTGTQKGKNEFNG